MEHPPEFLDGARVLQYASLARSRPSGTTRHVVEGLEVGGFAALAVTRYDGDSEGVYLFYCDEHWNVVTDTLHEDVASALQQANVEFGLLRFLEVTQRG